ncbi:hypothetical protein [Viridibacillus arvi]|uniref:hypothetical protein n=1 Tax=Viridibacillus arvi TaxID=263475 RepID=UPI0034CD01F5
MERPIGVTLISFFYIFGAVVLLLTSIFYHHEPNGIGIAERFGIPNGPERLVRVILALATFVMVYGYANLKKWGFWSMIVYSILFWIVKYNLNDLSKHTTFFREFDLVINYHSLFNLRKSCFFKSNQVS